MALSLTPLFYEDYCELIYISKHKVQYNVYIDMPDYIKYFANGQCFYVDRDHNKNTCYIRYKHGSKWVRFHRLLLEVTDNAKVVVDHINRNGLDNRRTNLRLATNQLNRFNSKKTEIKNKHKSAGYSKYKGVVKRSANCWGVRIGFNNERVYLGSFPTEKQAALAYNSKAKELFGEFAVLNEV